jgi:hypothetical protein
MHMSCVFSDATTNLVQQGMPMVLARFVRKSWSKVGCSWESEVRRIFSL